MSLALPARGPALADATRWPEGPAVSAALRPAVPRLIDDVIAGIRAEIPEYDRPLRGRFGDTVRESIGASIDRFLTMIAGEEGDPRARSDLYVELGRRELRSGRPIDTLLSAYRIGARVMWRGFAAEGQAAGLAPDALYRLAEALFAYVDELSRESSDGYAEERSLIAGARERERDRLLELLLRRPPADAVVMHAQAARAEWTIPDRFAPFATPAARLGARQLERGLPEGSMAATLDGVTVALVPDPDAPGRRAEIDRALKGAPAVRAGAAGWPDAAETVERVVLACRLQEAGVLPSDRLIAADDHLVELILHRDPVRARALSEGALRPLDQLSPAARERLTETLGAWLDHACRTTETAEALHVHVQTLRTRLKQVEQVLGPESLARTDRRLELQLALKVRRDHLA